MLASSNWTTRSKSVGTQFSSCKQRNVFLSTTVTAQANQSSSENSQSYAAALSSSPMKKQLQEQFYINVSQFDDVARDETADKLHSQLSATARLSKRREVYMKSRVKSNQFTNTTSPHHAESHCSKISTYDSNSKRQDQLIINEVKKNPNINLDIYLINISSETKGQLNASLTNHSNNSLLKGTFAATTNNLKYQKFNLINSNKQHQCPLTPSLPINKSRQHLTNIPKDTSQQSTKLMHRRGGNTTEINFKLSPPLDNLQTIHENNSCVSPPSILNSETNKKKFDFNNLRKYYLLSSVVKNPKSMNINSSNLSQNNNKNSHTINNSEINNNSQSKNNDWANNVSQKGLNPTSQITTMIDLDESQHAQSAELSNDIFINNRFKIKEYNLDLLKLENQFSNISKKSKNQDKSELKSPKTVNFSINTIPHLKSRSLSRIQLQKGQNSQEINNETPSLRQLSLKERLSMKDKSPNCSMSQAQIALIEKSMMQSQQISSFEYILTPVIKKEKILTPLSKKRNPSQVRSDSQVAASNRDVNSQFIFPSKTEIKFKQLNTKSIMANLLPLTLKRIVEKPFKQNVEILKYGIERSDARGPRICITEYEMFAIFQRIIDHYERAVRNEKDIFRRLTQQQNVLFERICNKIHVIQDAIKEIHVIKQGNSKLTKIIYNIFEGLKHLRFIFFKTEALTTPITELFSKDEQYPPLLNESYESKQIAERIYHQNFKKYFTVHDFDILLEYILIPDLDILYSRIENYVNRFNQNRLQEISSKVESTVSDMFKKQSEYIHTKRHPERIKEALLSQTPTFSSNAYNFTQTFFKKINLFERKENTKLQKSESQFQLNGQMDNLVFDISKTLKKYQFLSPYSDDIHPQLKQQLVKMYNTTSQEL